MADERIFLAASHCNVKKSDSTALHWELSALHTSLWRRMKQTDRVHLFASVSLWWTPNGENQASAERLINKGPFLPPTGPKRIWHHARLHKEPSFVSRFMCESVWGDCINQGYWLIFKCCPPKRTDIKTSFSNRNLMISWSQGWQVFVGFSFPLNWAKYVFRENDFSQIMLKTSFQTIVVFFLMPLKQLPRMSNCSLP